MKIIMLVLHWLCHVPYLVLYATFLLTNVIKSNLHFWYFMPELVASLFLFWLAWLILKKIFTILEN